jgi:hypothetical protein
MDLTPEIQPARRKRLSAHASLVRRLHMDGPLLSLLAAVILFGLFVLFSATGENVGQWLSQVGRLGLAVTGMVALAQVPPGWLRRASPILYGIGLVLLLLVAIHGSTTNGAQRYNVDGVFLVGHKDVHWEQVVRHNHDLALHFVAIGILIVLQDKHTTMLAVGITLWRFRAQHAAHFL